jgi:tRNA pseudouridine38-40 synthase
MRNVKLVIEYDGTNFCGWQRQPNVRTVQEELERSLSNIAQETVILNSSGRTDTGVHALGQVANFKTQSLLPIKTFVSGGNAFLPSDVRILEAQDVEMDFNARYSARSRCYRYAISKRPVAIDRNYAWYVSAPLDVMALQKASDYLIGEKDFQSFCQAKADVSHYICNVVSAVWKEEADRLLFEIIANRFLHNMVRIIVGTLVNVGRGKNTSEMVLEILAARDRCLAGSTAPARGLFLVRVNY